MANLRKRLIDLIHYCTSCEECHDADIADHLIANGVVISNLETTTKWIPVSERLPENKQTVLAIRKDGSMFIGYHITYIDTGRWHIWTARNSTKLITQIVTHWMPLPMPPEEG